MEFKPSGQYLLKCLTSLIQEEGNRIVSSGLATYDDLRYTLEHRIDEAVNKVGNDGEVLKIIAELHHDLTCIKLPGDFGHMKVEAKKTEKEESVAPMCVSEKPQDKDENVVLSTLESMAYELGKCGHHEAAYIIERAMRDIANIVKNAE